MKSQIWKTCGMTAPILLGLIGFSSPSEKLVGGGRVAVIVCGDPVKMDCLPWLNGEECKPFTKWGDDSVDNTPDDYYTRRPGELLNKCSTFNRNQCQGIGDQPIEIESCKNKVVDGN